MWDPRYAGIAVVRLPHLTVVYVSAEENTFKAECAVSVRCFWFGGVVHAWRRRDGPAVVMERVRGLRVVSSVETHIFPFASFVDATVLVHVLVR